MKPRRTCLSVPCSNPRMLAKAATLPADQLMLDLEDGVAPEHKTEARQHVSLALQQHDYGNRVVSLRVNGVDTSWCYRDLIDVMETVGDKVDTVVIPKVESAFDVLFIERLLTQMSAQSTGIDAIIESARGLLACADIAACSPRLRSLILGPGDLSASLGLSNVSIGHEAPASRWHQVRVTMLVAARAHGLMVIDGPYARIDDTEGLTASVRSAVELGFDGKWVIHPSQIETVNRLFTPDAETVRRAQGILGAFAAAGQGAVRFEGEMIDEATRKMAEV
ncbi:MAG: HpcH/HpaI aldolase/citrate lyase family protein, partial [Candidatus Xenobia bacterium]